MGSRTRLNAHDADELFAHVLSNISDELLLGMAYIAEGVSKIDRAAGPRFESVMAEHGPALYKEFELMTGCGLPLPSFMRFIESPKKTGRSWLVDDVRCATPAFGFGTLDAATAELWAMAASANGPAVSALFLPAPNNGETPFLLFVVFSDEAGNFGTGFGINGNFRWAALDPKPIKLHLERLLQYQRGLEPGFLDSAATRLAAELAKRGLGMPEKEAQSFLAEWLKHEMRPLGTLEPRAAHCLAETIQHVMQRMVVESEQGKVALHAKQLKSLRSELEKATLLSKGSQARAARLEAELKSLRQQTNNEPNISAVKGHQSIGQALDLLFE